MRIQVEHDGAGEIKSVAGAGPSVSTGRIARPNHQISVVDTDEVRHEHDFDGLRRLIEGYRITGHPHKPSLTRK